MLKRKNVIVFAGTNASGKKSIATALFMEGLFPQTEWEIIQSNALRINELCGYDKKVLIFCAAEDPEINLSYSKRRKKDGANDIPLQKIAKTRNEAFCNLLKKIDLFDHIFLIDNSAPGNVPYTMVSIYNNTIYPHLLTSPLWCAFIRQSIPLPVSYEMEQEHFLLLDSIRTALQKNFLKSIRLSWKQKSEILENSGWPKRFGKKADIAA